jgi:hypothetical protein
VAADLSVATDKRTYVFGDAARITVSIDFGDEWPGWSDFGATLKILLDRKDSDGTSQVNEYEPASLVREPPDAPAASTWFCHPIRPGMWGSFIAEATVFEWERQEVGVVETQFDVEGPADPGANPAP